jgi:hypothetical protein
MLRTLLECSIHLRIIPDPEVDSSNHNDGQT